MNQEQRMKQEFDALPKSNGGSGEDWKSLS